MYVEEAQLGARADGVEGARGSRHRYRIDHAEAHLRWHLAWEEPGQAPGWLPAGSPLVGLPPKVELEERATAARLRLRIDRRLDGRTHVKRVRAAVQPAVEKEHRRGVRRVLQRKRCASSRGGEKRLLLDPLMECASQHIHMF